MSPEAARARELFTGAEGPSAFVKQAYNYFGRAGWNRDFRQPMGSPGGQGGPGALPELPGGGAGGGAPAATGEPGGATGEPEGMPWWQKGLVGVEAAATLPSAIRAVQGPGSALATAAKGGKFVKGLGWLGAGMGAYRNAKGALTGDQGYESDSFWGQMGEQGLNTLGDLGSAVATGNPYAVIGVGATTAANIGANTIGAGKDVWDAWRNDGFKSKGAVTDQEVSAFRQRRQQRKADALGSTAGSVGATKP